MMEIRNPIFTETGAIDCEIKHEKYGWIPFTASENDVEQHGREIFSAALEMGPSAYVPPTPVPPTLDEYKNAVDAHVEETARSKGYNSAAHLSGYATSTVPTWASEAAAFISWRDQFWLTAIEILRQVTAGEIEQPTIEDLIASLPVINWPAE